MSKKIIAIDVDDVLKESSQLVVDFSNKEWRMNLTIDDYTESWHTMWQVDAAEGKRREEAILQMLVAGDPFIETHKVLKNLAQSYELVVTTSRSNCIADKTRQWLTHHYQDIFIDAHFTGIWDGDNSKGHEKLNHTKAYMLTEIGAAYLIDDHPKHCIAASKIGIPSILFGDYPWNRVEGLPADITRCLDWHGVEDYFDGRS